MIYRWLVPALVYMIAVGALGVTTKLALRGSAWPLLVISTTTVYAIISLVLLARGGVHFEVSGGSLLLVAVSGILTAGAFPLLVVALGSGDASRVIPVTAAYPIVTALLAAVFLSEGYSWRQIVGTAFVVLGAVLVAT
jgi:transporter family protein